MQVEEHQTTIQVPQGQTTDKMLSRLAAYSRKRGCVPIPVDFFTKVLPTLSEAELRVYLYQLYRTLGFGKQSDSIANQQFTDGIVGKDGVQHDAGCGLSSKRSVQQATQKLQQKGLINKAGRRKAATGDCPNHYTVKLKTITLPGPKEQTPEVPEKKQVGECKQMHPQTASSKLKTQRCKKQNKSKKTHFMDPDHVDYLVNQIEQATGDQHSRGGFAKIALTVEEGRIMELLVVLKDRTNIRNKGAWFITVAQQYVKKRIMPGDSLPEAPEGQPIPQTVSFKARLREMNRVLADKLGIPALDVSTQANHRTTELPRNGYLAVMHPT